MLKICHVLHDSKFIDHTFDLFQSKLFANKAVFLGSEKSYRGKYVDSIYFAGYGKRGVNNFLKICSGYDVVIFHCLDYYKSMIANRLPKKLKKVWFFYGYEFYRMPERLVNYYSSETKRSMNIGRCYRLLVWSFEVLRVFKYIVMFKPPPRVEFDRAVSGIDYFLCYDRQEYLNIKKHWKKFPVFIELSTFKQSESGKVTKGEGVSGATDQVVIGNSRTPLNNHLDVIDLFEKYLTFDGVSLLFPVSYGKKGKYYKRLMEKIGSSQLNIEILDDFLPYEAYAKKIVGAKAAVINSYRPMAKGNIFLHLKNGVKLYLSEKNPNYDWLKSLGFFVFSIEADLKGDVAVGRLSLEPHQSENNRNIFNKLSDRDSVSDFLNGFYVLFRKSEAGETVSV